MLNEEVAKYRELSGDTNPNTPISRIGGYLDGYEKALEQEPCEDAISREDALMCLTGEIKDTDTIETIIARFVRRIRKLPSVKPQEPKTGYWMIDEDSTDRFFATYECSCCKRAIIIPHDLIKAVYKDYPFCHCGAKMVKPQESEG